MLDGRDIGTVICPDADVKLFVTAALPVRTERRLTELHGRGETDQLEAVQAQIAERDARDMNRADSPLRQAPDAHLLDTTHLSIEAAVEAACRIVDAALGASRGPDGSAGPFLRVLGPPPSPIGRLPWWRPRPPEPTGRPVSLLELKYVWSGNARPMTPTRDDFAALLDRKPRRQAA